MGPVKGLYFIVGRKVISDIFFTLYLLCSRNSSTASESLKHCSDMENAPPHIVHSQSLNRGCLSEKNYYGTTLLSCLGKLFTSIIYGILTKFSNRRNIAKEIQAGFRQGYSTLDHIFLLKSIIDLFLWRRKKQLSLYWLQGGIWHNMEGWALVYDDERKHNWLIS